MWVISFSFVYTRLLIWVFPQSQRFNLTCCSKLSLLLTFCFLFICRVDPSQICPSSISPCRLFQQICNIERLEGRTLEHWITGWPYLKEGYLGPLFIPCKWFFELKTISVLFLVAGIHSTTNSRSL